MATYKRVLLPVDGSPTAAMGMAEAIKLAAGGRSRLLLLHIIDESMIFAMPDVSLNIDELLEAARKGGRRVLQQAARRAARSGARPQLRLVENPGGRVADAIMREAKRARADLIVMGTHGRRGVRRALLGSDAENVVRMSAVPVLLVPARGRKRG